MLEWSEEYEEPEPGHRHISRLFALHPFEVNLKWKGGRVESAEIRSLAGLPCRLRAGLPIAVKSGCKPVKIEQPEPGVVVFATEAGKSYIIEPSKTAEQGAK